MGILHTRRCYLAAESNRPMTCTTCACGHEEVSPKGSTLCDSIAASQHPDEARPGRHTTPLVARDWGRVQYRRGSRELLVGEEDVSYHDCSHTQLHVVVKPIELCT